MKIAGTVDEGDDVAGFEVVHIPGHAPGMIALFRESDRVALTSDCFYTLDIGTGRHGAARLPSAGFNLDTEQARASMPQDRRDSSRPRLAGPRRRRHRRRPRPARAGSVGVLSGPAQPPPRR